MDKMLKIAVILTAYDRMTRVTKEATDKASQQMKALKNQSMADFGKGGALMAAGVGLSMVIGKTVQDFAELEESATRLETAMMNSAGQTSSFFNDVNKLAVNLGDKLPGTTADFQNMFRELLNNGIKAQDILGGVGKAAAYLAVDLKLPYEEAAAFAAKLKSATGIANQDFMKFMDTVSRTATLGVKAEEMQYAFGKSSGALKLMGIQGLKASNDMAVLYASMIRLGASGETVGTSFSTVINSILDKKKMGKMSDMAAQAGISFNFFKGGKFAGVENMVQQFDKLKNLSIQQRASIVNALTGGGQDASMVQNIISMGVGGYRKLRAEMEAKANLDAKVTKQLGTLNQIWEATTGTITNLSAQFGSALAPELKKVADFIGRVAGRMRLFLEAHPIITKTIAIVIALTAVILTLAGVIFMARGAMIAFRIAFSGFAVIGKIIPVLSALITFVRSLALTSKIAAAAQWLFNTALWACPLVWIIAAVAALIAIVVLMVKNWDKVKSWFTGFGRWIKGAWGAIVNFFKISGKAIVSFIFPFNLLFEIFRKLWPKLKEAGANIIKSIWEGLKSMAMKPIEFIKNLVQKIRNFLPFSPAKEGPLKDIHKIRLIETIFENVKPAKAVAAMRQTIGAMVNVSGGSLTPKLGVAGGGSVTVNFNVNVNGGNSSDFVAQLKKYEPELIRTIENAMARRERRAF
jgi:TP901 family phage tail tape measure protein